MRIATLTTALLALPLAAMQAHAQPTILAERELQPEGFGTLHVEAGLVPVAAGPDSAKASAGYISYVSAEPEKDRPVIFAFNGGPGASSTFLHMGLLGPTLAHVPQDPANTGGVATGAVTGSRAVFDIADIVLIDPPGTGFSARPDGAAAAPYDTVAGDARAVAELVKAWLDTHGRADTPFYVLGESYGTIRAVGMLDALEELGIGDRLRGIVLLGQALNMIETSQRPDNVVTYPVSLPTLSAIACYHAMVAQPCDVDAITAEAARFGQEEYLPALFLGADLPPDERERIAARLEALTGIAADYYLAHDLRISKERFRVELLRTKGKVTGRYDARYLDDRPDDVTVMMPGDPSSVISDAYGAAMGDYLADVLKVPDASAYQIINRFGTEWRYGGADSPFTDWPFMATVERHAEANRCLRVFVGTGIFDTTTTIGAADYLFAQSSLPASRYRNEKYVGGHVFYSDDSSRAQFQSDLVDFIKADSCQ